MSTGTQTLNHADAVAGTGSKSVGILQRALRRVMEAQERKAVTIVRQYLARLSDEHLAELDYGPAEIKAIRRHADSPVAGWL